MVDSILYTLLFITIFTHSCCIHLSEKEHEILEKVITEYESNPTNPLYHRIFISSGEDRAFLPKILIWDPIVQFSREIVCPLHKCVLRCGRLTTELRKVSGSNPRLVYDIGGNIILVQRNYLCSGDDGDQRHQYMSASLDIISTLDPSVSQFFPVQLDYQSGYTRDLLDFLLVSIQQGQTFLQVSETLLSLNYRKYCNSLMKRKLCRISHLTVRILRERDKTPKRIKENGEPISFKRRVQPF